MKTTVYIGTSLDGFIARKDGDIDWLTQFANDEAIQAYEAFIKKISSSLEVLRLKTSSDTAYLNAHRWKHLIKKHMPHLRDFYFNHQVFIDGDDTIPNYESINQFNSSFWIERQWFFELENNVNICIYSIQPYR